MESWNAEGVPFSGTPSLRVTNDLKGEICCMAQDRTLEPVFSIET